MSNWLQFLIFAIFLSAPALSWAVQKLREQADVKRQRAEAARRREEELRTGRVSDPQRENKPSSVREDRMTELQRLAERRQQQLRELRERQSRQVSGKNASMIAPMPPQAGGSGSGQRLPKGQGMRGQPLPNRRTAQQQQNRGATGQPQPGQRQRPAQNPIGSRPATQSQSPIRQDQVDIRSMMRQAEKTAPPAVIEGRSISQQLSDAPVSDASVVRNARSGTSTGVSAEVRSLLRGSTRKDGSGPKLATLLAINEVLSKPVSMREPGESGIPS